MIFDLPLQAHSPTFYTRHGDWFGWGCVGFTVLLIVSGRGGKECENVRT
jgi:apolipoprotein N-acyltransferase